MIIYLNGEYVPAEEARVSVFDRGFLYGDGIYETLRVYGGRVFKLEEHLVRLERSAQLIRMDPPLSREAFAEAIDTCLKVNDLSDALVRIGVSRGEASEPGLDPALVAGPPTVVIAPRSFEPYPEAMYEAGIRAAVVSVRRNPTEALNPAIKSTNFLNNILAKMEALEAGADEAIMLNTDGHIAEGTTTNIFWVAGYTLCTPPLEAGVLDGVTRSVTITLAEDLDYQILEVLRGRSALEEAEEVFVTSTSYEIMPVTSIDGKPVGSGRAGPMSLELLSKFRGLYW
ncbi:MAG: aminotransferase class IV [bacterium]|nr:aminotransferase class IV [bacterium]